MQLRPAYLLFVVCMHVIWLFDSDPMYSCLLLKRRLRLPCYRSSYHQTFSTSSVHGILITQQLTLSFCCSQVAQAFPDIFMVEPPENFEDPQQVAIFAPRVTLCMRNFGSPNEVRAAAERATAAQVNCVRLCQISSI